jgi:hypothetical protein
LKSLGYLDNSGINNEFLQIRPPWRAAGANNFNGLQPNRGFSEQWNNNGITAEFAGLEQQIIAPEQHTPMVAGPPASGRGGARRRRTARIIPARRRRI